MHSLLERIGAWADPPPGSAWHENLVWLRRLLLLHVAVRMSLNELSGRTPELWWVGVGIAIGAAAASFHRRFVQPATIVASLVIFTQLGYEIVNGSDVANHVFLEWVLMTFFALAPIEYDEEARLLLRALRWTLAVFFFHTGLQKLLHGYYFDGQYLAYLAAGYPEFGMVFQHVIPAAEFEKLQSYFDLLRSDPTGLAAIGAGPFAVDAPLLKLLSNGVYLGEMATGVLLALPRARTLGALLGMAMLLGIELGAREVTFGLLTQGLLCSCLHGPWVRRYLVFYGIVVTYLLLGALGLVPIFEYSYA